METTINYMKKIDSYKIIKNWVPRFIIISAVILVVLTLYFIYKNVWEIFSRSEESSLLQEMVAPAELKIDVFQKIGENLKNKKSEVEIDFQNLKNPFGLTEKSEEPKIR